MDQNQHALRAAQTNRALGLFLLFFGFVVLVSIFFTETTVGKLTNLAAAGIIGLIGGAMVVSARRHCRKSSGSPR